MSGLKYNDFPSGTYDTSKIFLQADPTTGELEQINLPTIGAGSPRVAVDGTEVTNPNSTAIDFCSYTIPANTLSQDGDQFQSTCYYEIINTAAATTITLFWNATTTFSNGAAALGRSTLTVVLWRTSSTTAKWIGILKRGNFIATTTQGTISSLDFTVTNVLKFQIQASAASQFRFDIAFHDYYPHP